MKSVIPPRSIDQRLTRLSGWDRGWLTITLRKSCTQALLTPSVLKPLRFLDSTTPVRYTPDTNDLKKPFGLRSSPPLLIR